MAHIRLMVAGMHLATLEKCVWIQTLMALEVVYIIEQKQMENCIALNGIRMRIKTGITIRKMPAWQEEPQRLGKLHIILMWTVY